MPSQAVAALNSDYLLERIADGAFLRDLAAETGIDKRRLSERLRQHPDYASAKESAIECQLDDAQEAIRLSREAQDIARAREQFRAAAWRAERECNARWGSKHEITQTVTVTIEQTLSADARALLQHVRGRVIEHEDTQDVVVDDDVQPQQHDTILAITQDDSVK